MLRMFKLADFALRMGKYCECDEDDKKNDKKDEDKDTYEKTSPPFQSLSLHHRNLWTNAEFYKSFFFFH